MAGRSALSSVQARVFALLDADSGLDAALGNGKVFDHVPTTTTYPYLCITEIKETPDDTLGSLGRNVTVTLDAYSQVEGYKELQTIVEETIRVLNDDDISGLTDGWKVGSSIYSEGELTREIDGLTRHANMVFMLEVYV